MLFDTFKEELIEQLQLRGLEVETKEVTKVNETLTAIMLKDSNSSIRATPYIEKLHEAFEQGVPMTQILKDTVYIFNKTDLSLDDLTKINGEKAKENLYCQLVNRERNQELLKNVPHMDIEDMSLIARFQITENANLIVKNDMCREWKMTPDEVLECARKNTYQNFTLERIEDVIRNTMLKDGFPPEEISNLLPENLEEARLYVLSNSKGVFGAAVGTSNDILDKVYSELGEHNFYLLPSSTHEFLIMPDNGNMKELDLKDMVEDANQNCINIADFLSDNIYYYNGKTHLFSLAENKEVVKIDKSEKVITRGR